MMNCEHTCQRNSDRVSACVLYVLQILRARSLWSDSSGCTARVTPPPVQRLWECGEFGRARLIKHCALALQTGKQRPMGKPHKAADVERLSPPPLLSSPTHVAAQLTQGSGPFGLRLWQHPVSVTSFISAKWGTVRLL